MSANGYLDPNELVTVQSQGNIQLSVTTAAAWNAAKAAAAREGVTLSIVLPVGGYRSRWIQQDMRVHPKLYNITPGIVPGLPSEHGWGHCVDVSSGQAWMVANGGRFGFHRTQLAIKDYNHFQHDGSATAGSGGSPAIPVVTPPPPPPPYLAPLEDDMFKLYYRKDAPTAASPSGVTYALGVLDPSWQTPGHNFWFEATAESRRDWRELFGFRDVDGNPQAQLISADIWNARSNDPNRIGDVSKYVPLVNAGTVTAGTASPVDLSGLLAAVAKLQATVDAFPKPPTKFVAE